MGKGARTWASQLGTDASKLEERLILRPEAMAADAGGKEHVSGKTSRMGLWGIIPAFLFTCFCFCLSIISL